MVDLVEAIDITIDLFEQFAAYRGAILQQKKKRTLTASTKQPKRKKGKERKRKPESPRDEEVPEKEKDETVTKKHLLTISGRPDNFTALLGPSPRWILR